mmetsp:Transcript_41717/g.68632  ORF Transcript_41717/g.68632 Transcript_41717/m.68632 type:complete len:379 (-) Transcript_41717:839-1975(-)
MSVVDMQSENGEIPIDAELERILLKPFTENTSKYAFRGWKSLAYLHSLDDIVYHDFKRVFQFQDFDKKFKWLQANEKTLMERMELLKQIPIRTLRAKYAPKVALSSRRKHVSKRGSSKHRRSSSSSSSSSSKSSMPVSSSRSRRTSSSSSSSFTPDGKHPSAYEVMMPPSSAYPHMQCVPEHPAYYHPQQYEQAMMPIEMVEVMEPMEPMEPVYPPHAMNGVNAMPAYVHFDQMGVSYYSPYPYPYHQVQPQPQPQQHPHHPHHPQPQQFLPPMQSGYEVNADGCYYVCAPLPDEFPDALREEHLHRQTASNSKRKAKSRESRRVVSPPIAPTTKAEYGEIVEMVDGRSQSSQDNISSISAANDNFSSTSLSSVVDHV